MTFAFRLLCAALLLGAASSGAWAAPAPAKPAKKPAPTAAAPAVKPAGDILVTVATAGGTFTYGGDLVSMDILVDDTGLIRMLHLIHVSGQEKDTHTWYNFEAVQRFSYRYFAITGKGKVRVKKIAPPPATGEEGAVPPVRYEEFR